MNISDCFAILELPYGADERSVKASYRRLAKIHHPDISQDNTNTQAFLDIQYAYETILKYYDFRSKYGELIGGLIVDYTQSKAEAKRKKEQERRERIIKIQQIKEKKKTDEIKLIQSLFEDYKTSKKIRIVKFNSVVSLLVFIVLLFDYVIPPEIQTITIEKTDVVSNGMAPEYYLIHKNERINVSEAFFYSVVGKKEIKRDLSPVFKTPKKLYYSEENLKYYESTHSFFFDSTPILLAMLLLPLLSFLIMKPNFTFVLIITTFNLYIVPFLWIIILVGNFRIVNLVLYLHTLF